MRMKENGIIIKYIEKIRLERKIKIRDLTEGIIAQRTYSRYVAENQDLPLDIITKFLNRLNIPVFELAGYIRNDLFFQHIDEIWFHEHVRLGEYQKAYTEYYSKIKDMPLGNYFHPRAIPCAMIKMEYHLNQITRVDAQTRMEALINLDAIIKQNFLVDDDVHALRLFVEFCDDEDKEKIAYFLCPKIEEDKLKIITQTIETSMNIVHVTVLMALTTKAVFTRVDHDWLNRILPPILQYNKRSKPAIFDIELFEILFKHMKTNNFANRAITFYYISAVLSALGGYNTKDAKITLTPEDVDTFLSCLADKDFLAKPMYEELINHGIS